jgi:hypothetical protein
MRASKNGHLEIVHTLLQGKADVNAKDEVRNQIMMIIIKVLFTTLMMMMIVINDEDGDVCR